MDSATDLRYPVGPFVAPALVTPEMRSGYLLDLGAAPGWFRDAVHGLSDDQLDTPYRPGGWTVRQVIHHVADSHVNSYIRFKQAVTEDGPTIRTYDEAVWAELPEARSAPVSVSLSLLEALHDRWTRFLTALPAAAFARPLQHPEQGPMTVDTLLALYAWHGRHHTAHITELRRRMGWA